MTRGKRDRWGDRKGQSRRYKERKVATVSPLPCKWYGFDYTPYLLAKFEHPRLAGLRNTFLLGLMWIGSEIAVQMSIPRHISRWFKLQEGMTGDTYGHNYSQKSVQTFWIPHVGVGLIPPSASRIHFQILDEKTVRPQSSLEMGFLGQDGRLFRVKYAICKEFHNSGYKHAFN